MINRRKQTNMDERIEIDDDDTLPEQFVGKFVAMWARYGLPVPVLADAMLAAAINLMGASHGRTEASRVLRDVADSIDRAGVAN